MFNKLTALVCLLFSLTASFAQQVIPCATDELHVQQTMVDPLARTREEQANALIRQQVNSFTKKANGIIYIPVVFHIISNSAKDSSENISQFQIMDQIRIINEDFRRKENTAGFSTDAASTDLNIEFRLAQYDPNGNKHDGINRINSTLTSDARDNVKALSYWDSNKYLNVWVVKSINAGFSAGQGIVLGYAQFPWDRNSKPTTDGVVVRSDQIGVVGSGQTSQGGRTLTHEIGHWLGLYHTFQGGCNGGTSSNCASQGDQVCDTPPVATSSSGCNVGQNSCTNDVPDLPDMVRNYMDYSDGTCMNTYTAGQKNRVYGFLPMYRNTIYNNGLNDVSYAGIAADGSYLTVPASPFTAPIDMSYEGTSFTDQGWKVNNFGNALNGWQLNNAVSYSGTSSMYMHNFTNTTAKINSRDGFQSPEYNLSVLAAPFVEFQYAYAQRSSASNDSLVLIISNNFGMGEQRIFAKTASDLSTGGVTTSEFIPANDQWKKVSIDLSAYRSFTHARFRFEFVNRRGNNVYVDDFKLTNWVAGLEENAKQAIDFKVFPNPMTESSTLTFELQQTDNVTIALYDLAGKEISLLANQIFSTGKQELTLSSNALKPGMYIIRFESNDAAFSHKLLIN
ncbi:MAG: M43 family zinc metalloprotease [Bacteroidota bacterium]